MNAYNEGNKKKLTQDQCKLELQKMMQLKGELKEVKNINEQVKIDINKEKFSSVGMSALLANDTKVTDPVIFFIFTTTNI